jgi:hypothetical protein
MGEASAIIISLVIDEDLGLIFQAPESGGMQDAIPVTLECRAILRLVFWKLTAFRILAQAAIRSKVLHFKGFELLT